MEKKWSKKYNHSLSALLSFIADPGVIMDSSGQVLKIENKLADRATLRVNTNKIKLVFINRVKNAGISKPDGDKITVKNTETKCTITSSFNDAGIGISGEALPKLFSPVYTTKAVSYTHLTLPTKRIV